MNFTDCATPYFFLTIKAYRNLITLRRRSGRGEKCFAGEIWSPFPFKSKACRSLITLRRRSEGGEVGLFREIWSPFRSRIRLTVNWSPLKVLLEGVKVLRRGDLVTFSFKSKAHRSLITLRMPSGWGIYVFGDEIRSPRHSYLNLSISVGYF